MSFKGNIVDVALKTIQSQVRILWNTYISSIALCAFQEVHGLRYFPPSQAAKLSLFELFL